MRSDDEGRVHGAFSRTAEGVFEGWALDASDPGARLIVEIVLDGRSIATVRADRAQAGQPAASGFAYVCNPQVLVGQDRIAARVANRGEPIGAPIDLRRDAIDAEAPTLAVGSVAWHGGRRLGGWVRDEEGAVVVARVGGEEIARLAPDPWSLHERPFGAINTQRAFTLDLPETVEDGRFRLVEVTDGEGRPLVGSPVGVVAYRDGLAAFLAEASGDLLEDPRVALFDRLLGPTIPFADHEAWRVRWLGGAGGGDLRRVAFVFTGGGAPDETIRSLDDTALDWVAAVLDRDPRTGAFEPARLRAFLEDEVEPDRPVVFVRSGTRLTRDGVAALTGALDDPDVVLAYADVEIERNGRGWPWLMPAFDLERFLEQGYAAQAFACGRETVLGALSDGAASVYDVILAAAERHGCDAIGHVAGARLRCPPAALDEDGPALLGATRRHLVRQDGDATASLVDGPDGPVIRVRREPVARAMSVIVPTRDQAGLLETCVTSLTRQLGRIAIELIIVDNGSRDPDALDYLRNLERDGARIVRDRRAFNYARMNNDAVAIASNPVVCLLNNDTEFVEPVFEEMLGRLSPPDVGAVGVLMARETDVIQHGGVVLGHWYGAMHAFEDRMLRDPGYGGLLTTAHEVSAVTAACMVLRKADFLGVGGFDARRFPITFNDVDLCLKLRAAGKRIVMTPHVHIRHHESASRGHDADLAKRARAARELAMLRQRWGHVLTDDPLYNPYFSLGTYPYAGLAAVPRPAGRVRRNIGLPPLDEPFPT